KLTEVAKPERPDLDKELLTENVRDGATLAAHAKAIQTAAAEMQSMVSLARRMAEQAKPNVQGETVSLEWARAQSAHHDQMDQEVAEEMTEEPREVQKRYQACSVNQSNARRRATCVRFPIGASVPAA